MKKTFFVALAAMMLTLSANAQNSKSSSKSKTDQSEMVEKITDEMVSTYGLNSKQAKKLKTLNEKYADSLPMMSGGSRPDGVSSASSNSNRQASPQKGGQGGNKSQNTDNSKIEAYNKELKSIIGDENYSKYESSSKKQMNRGEKKSKD